MLEPDSLASSQSQFVKRHQKQTGPLLFQPSQQYRSPPRIEAMITEPPSNDKSAQESCVKSPHEVVYSGSSVNILKKLNEARGTLAYPSKAKDRYINKAKDGQYTDSTPQQQKLVF